VCGYFELFRGLGLVADSHQEQRLSALWDSIGGTFDARRGFTKFCAEATRGMTAICKERPFWEWLERHQQWMDWVQSWIRPKT
jgi:hypothetical protein